MNAPVHAIAKRFSNILQIHYIHYDIAEVERTARCEDDKFGNAL